MYWPMTDDRHITALVWGTLLLAPLLALTAGPIYAVALVACIGPIAYLLSWP